MRALAAVLSLALVLPAGADSKPKDPLVGAWSGTAKFTAAAGTPPCVWVGGHEPPAATLTIARSAEALTGTLSLEFPAAGQACPALQIKATLKDVTATDSTLAFKDEAGREWNLGLKLGRLQGLVAGADGSGEVSLGHGAGGARGGGGGLTSGALGIVGANVIGIGALVGINALAKDNKTAEGGIVANCSPRVCTVGGPGEPCDCSGNIIAGGACGTTTAGQSVNTACSLPDLPCQANLSCNNAVCEDRFGRCTF